MDLKEIITRLSVFFLPGAVLIVTILAVSLLIYKFRMGKGGVSSSGGHRKKQIITGSLLAGYLFLVFGLTNLSRGDAYTGSINLSLFSGYIDAWNAYSLIAFQLIVFNIIMFMPLGVLLPLFHSRFKKLYWTMAASFGVTLFIEIFQFTTGRGIFELDDIFHNTLGGVIGYQLYLFVYSVYKDRRITLKSFIKYLSIPIIFTVVFVSMLTYYHAKEFGNMSINPTYGTDMSNVALSTTIELSSNSVFAPVYKNKYSNNKEHGRSMAELIGKSLKLPDLSSEGRDGENVQYLYKEEGGTRYYMTYFVEDGTWFLNDDNFNYEEVLVTQSEEMEGYAETILTTLDVLPKQAELSITDDGVFRWSMERSSYPKEDIEDGQIMMSLKKDGTVGSLIYNRTENEFVREVELLSTAEAFEKIREGKFDQMIPFQKGDQLIITQYKLAYMYDSKGYYQPVYHFSGTHNGEEWAQFVTAIR